MSRQYTRIATVIALAFASAASAQQAVYTHDFDSIGGWPDSDVSGDLTAVYTVVGSEYLINPLQNMAYALAPAPASSPSPDMLVEADVRLAASQPQSRAGIACRVGSDGSFYAFNLIASGAYEIVRVKGGNGVVLASGGIGFDPSGYERHSGLFGFAGSSGHSDQYSHRAGLPPLEYFASHQAPFERSHASSVQLCGAWGFGDLDWVLSRVPGFSIQSHFG